MSDGLAFSIYDCRCNLGRGIFFCKGHVRLKHLNKGGKEDENMKRKQEHWLEFLNNFFTLGLLIIMIDSMVGIKIGSELDMPYKFILVVILFLGAVMMMGGALPLFNLKKNLV